MINKNHVTLACIPGQTIRHVFIIGIMGSIWVQTILYKYIPESGKLYCDYIEEVSFKNDIRLTQEPEGRNFNPKHTPKNNAERLSRGVHLQQESKGDREANMRLTARRTAYEEHQVQVPPRWVFFFNISM